MPYLLKEERDAGPIILAIVISSLGAEIWKSHAQMPTARCCTSTLREVIMGNMQVLSS